MIDKKKSISASPYFLFGCFRRTPEPAHVGDASALDASANLSPSRAQQDGGELVDFLRPAPAGQDVSFSDVVRPSRATNELPVAYVPDHDNELPSRPLTTFFTPRYRVPANEVFNALKDAGVNSGDISCIQRQSSGEIVLTFSSAQFTENFLQKNLIKVRDQPFHSMKSTIYGSLTRA